MEQSSLSAICESFVHSDIRDQHDAHEMWPWASSNRLHSVVPIARHMRISDVLSYREFDSMRVREQNLKPHPDHLNRNTSQYNLWLPLLFQGTKRAMGLMSSEPGFGGRANENTPSADSKGSAPDTSFSNTALAPHCTTAEIELHDCALLL